MSIFCVCVSDLELLVGGVVGTNIDSGTPTATKACRNTFDHEFSFTHEP
jgi:hypothetical protein